jgi:hypothetical protein
MAVIDINLVPFKRAKKSLIVGVPEENMMLQGRRPLVPGLPPLFVRR